MVLARDTVNKLSASPVFKKMSLARVGLRIGKYLCSIACRQHFPNPRNASENLSPGGGRWMGRVQYCGHHYPDANKGHPMKVQ